MSMVDHYEVLGITKSATDIEIRKAYHSLAIKWHPDKNPGIVQEATAKFHLILEAYKILMDTDKRRTYDNALTLQKFMATISGPVQFLNSQICKLSAELTVLDVVVNISAFSMGTYCLIALLAEDD